MYRQVIIDAKALRASSIANAKASLQEAFEPKIQEMLRMKLSEDFEESLSEEEEDVKQEGYDHVEENYEDGMEEGMPEEGITESDLDEILSELESIEEGDYEEEGALNEAEEDEDEEGEEGEEGDDDEMEPPTEGGEEDEMEITIKFGELKDLLTPFVGEPEEGGEEAPEMSDLPSDEDGSEDDSLSLDEILAELEEEDGEKVEEAKGQIPGYGKVGGKGTTGYDDKVGGQGRTGYDAGSKKLHEANETIKILSEKLNEINLLNAKLLYMNRIFKSKSLSEAQKVRVVKSFDKATSVKEVKNVYEILSEAFSNRSKAPLKESRGFASKPTGGLTGTKKPIVESDPTVDRWQQLVFGNK
jgi:hypothetical protein